MLIPPLGGRVSLCLTGTWELVLGGGEKPNQLLPGLQGCGHLPLLSWGLLWKRDSEATKGGGLTLAGSLPLFPRSSLCLLGNSEVLGFHPFPRLLQQ